MKNIYFGTFQAYATKGAKVEDQAYILYIYGTSGYNWSPLFQTDFGYVRKKFVFCFVHDLYCNVIN